jgi:NADH-quinone oxidoreductase subunit K
MITLNECLMVSAMVFALGVVGVVINRRNVIILLVCIELILLSASMNFVVFSHYLSDLGGEIFVFFVLAVAAVESAIALAIIVLLHRNCGSIEVDDLDRLKG